MTGYYRKTSVWYMTVDHITKGQTSKSPALLGKLQLVEASAITLQLLLFLRFCRLVLIQLAR